MKVFDRKARQDCLDPTEFHRQTQKRLASHADQFRIETSDLNQTFPAEFKSIFKGTPILILGDGDWYHGWNSVEYRLNHITDEGGRNRYIHDPKYLKFDTVDFKLVEAKAGSERDLKTIGTIISSPTEIPPNTIALILSPNHFHLSQLKDCLADGNISGIYVEKPMVINGNELLELEEIIRRSEKPVYFGDHYLFEGVGLFALLGKPMPYKNLLTYSSDPKSPLRKSCEQNRPILNNIVKIEGQVTFGGHDNLFDERGWLREPSAGGGVLLDLGIHIFNLIHNLGFKVKNIVQASLKVISSETEISGEAEIQRGEYADIPTGSNRAEDFAMIEGEMLSGASYAFKFAQFETHPKNYLQLFDEDNKKLRLLFKDQKIQYLGPDNRVIDKMVLKTDAVLLLMHHALSYFKSGEKAPMFFGEQRASIELIEKIKSWQPGP
jgi:predicted dehydrogenase